MPGIMGAPLADTPDWGFLTMQTCLSYAFLSYVLRGAGFEYAALMLPFLGGDGVARPPTNLEAPQATGRFRGSGFC